MHRDVDVVAAAGGLTAEQCHQNSGEALQRAQLIGDRKPARVRVRIEVEKWDTSLLLFLFEAQQWCVARGAQCAVDALPEKIRTLLSQLARAHEGRFARQARNEALDATPELVNTDPYGQGWMIVVKYADAKELDTLMSAAEYEKLIAAAGR